MRIYHKLKGAVNYTVVGSPTIVDGVASGFSSSNYLKTAANNPTTDIANVFFQAKVTVAAGANEQAILGYRSAAGNGFCGIYLRLDSNRINWDYGKNADTGTTVTLTTANNSIAVGDSLIIQAYFSEGNPVLRFSKDNGQTWVQNTAAVSSSLALLSTEYPFNIGVSNVGYYAVNQGTIDLNNTYIKVNGQPWFGVCPVEVKKHQVKGPVGYTVMGSPTITEGVASGFSNGNFLELSQVLSLSASDSVEALFDITTGTDMSSEQFFFSGLGNSFAAVTRWGLYAGHLVFSGNGSGFTPYEEGTELLAANTNYKVKLTYENQIVNMYLFVNNAWQKEITINNISFASFNRMLLGSWTQAVYENTSFAFRGSIDLNNTYIKVNGKLWYWQPQETKKIVVNNTLAWEKTV